MFAVHNYIRVKLELVSDTHWLNVIRHNTATKKAGQDHSDLVCH